MSIRSYAQFCRIWLSRQFWRFRLPRRERLEPLPDMRVTRGDRAYRRQAEEEERFWENPPLNTALFEAVQTDAYRQFTNAAYTGNPDRSWMDDLLARGPFDRAAALGSTQGVHEALWLEQGGSRLLDVYDISVKVLARARKRLSSLPGLIGDPPAKFFRADLNFVELPRDEYDVVWTSGCLHHVTNLEYLFGEIDRSLRPGGILAVFDYIGEPRSQYSPERLRAMNEVFRQVPRVFRYADRVEVPPPEHLSPFEGIRANETLGLIRERFDVAHLAEAGALYPMGLLIDFAGIEREEPSLLQFIFDADEAARQNGSLTKCSMYGVFRKRPSS